VRPGQQVEFSPAAGLKKVAGEVLTAAEDASWLAKWEPMEKQAGQQGLGIIAGGGGAEKRVEDALNHLLVLRGGTQASWWAGFCWDKAGPFSNAEAWSEHVRQTAARLAKPVRVDIKP
jgi:hypothetical protein